MKIEEAVQLISRKLGASFQPGSITVGHNADTIFIYEHVRGLTKRRVPTGFESQFKVVRKYVGKIRPA
jgi:hypothetical protein